MQSLFRNVVEHMSFLSGRQVVVVAVVVVVVVAVVVVVVVVVVAIAAAVDVDASGVGGGDDRQAPVHRTGHADCTMGNCVQ